MTPRLAAYLSIASLVTAFRQIDYGTFIYEVKKPHPFKLTFTTTHDDYGLFVVQCGKKQFRDNWLKLTVDEGDAYSPTLHEFPDTDYGKVCHKRWVDYARATCPKLKFDDTDFQYWYVDAVGDAVTEIGGKEVFMPRQWYPLIPGRYWSEPSISPLRMKFDIHFHGYVYAVLGCEEGDTGTSKRFRLVKHGGDERYKLTAIKSLYTVRDLLESFKQVCPHLWGPSYEDALQNIRFPNYDAVQVFGDFGTDRLFRKYL